LSNGFSVEKRFQAFALRGVLFQIRVSKFQDVLYDLAPVKRSVKT
jgi:hypothetical protein